MNTTTPHHTPNPAGGDHSRPAGNPETAEPTGTVWVDFGDGGSARWTDLSLHTLDQICAQLETIKPADTLT